MGFSILNYKNVVAQRLNVVPPIYRCCFAVWCLHAIFNRWGKRFSIDLAESDVEFMRDSINILWKCVISNEQPTIEQLSAIEKGCRSIELDDISYATEPFIVAVLDGLLNIVTLFRNGDARYSAQLAEAIIDCINANLSENPEYIMPEDISTNHEINAELHIQEKMLKYVETLPNLRDNDISLFRSSGA